MNFKKNSIILLLMSPLFGVLTYCWNEKAHSLEIAELEDELQASYLENKLLKKNLKRAERKVRIRNNQAPISSKKWKPNKEKEELNLRHLRIKEDLNLCRKNLEDFKKQVKSMPIPADQPDVAEVESAPPMDGNFDSPSARNKMEDDEDQENIPLYHSPEDSDSEGEAN